MVKFILSNVYVETESELLILLCILRHHSSVTAFVSRSGGQLVVMVQKLLKGPLISSCVLMLSKYFQSKRARVLKLLTGSKLIKLKIAPLSELHDHLADGLPVVCLLMGLVHCHTHCSGAGKVGISQASSGETHLVRVSWL